MRTRSALTLLSSLFFFAGSNANATLIADSGSILDSETGLHWLPMSETVGLSFDEVVTQPNARGATLNEMSALFAAYPSEQIVSAFGMTQDGVAISIPATIGIYDDFANEAGALRIADVVFIDGAWQKRLFSGAAVSDQGFGWMGIWTVVVPEPSTALLMGLGLAALGVRRRA